MEQPQGPQRSRPRSSEAAAAGVEQVLGPPEDGGVHQGRLLAVVDLVLVTHLAHVQDVGQQPPQAHLGERLAAAVPARTRPPTLVRPAPLLQLAHQRRQRPVLQQQREDGPHALGLLGVDRQALAARVQVVAQQRPAAGPLALAARGGHLVAGALGDDLALELGEG
jgi:hypothetical protein